MKLPSKCSILDLGANVGYTAAHFAHIYPRADIVAVEMDQANADLAERNLSPWRSRCKLIHAAVWTADGEITYGGKDEESYHVHVPGELAHFPARKAPSKTIEGILSESGLGEVDYMKMDIEGAEDEIFRGDLRWAERVGSMKIEIHKPADMGRCSEALAKADFRCWKDNRHWSCLVAVARRRLA